MSKTNRTSEEKMTQEVKRTSCGFKNRVKAMPGVRAYCAAKATKSHAAKPHAAKPHAAKPHAAKPHAAEPHAAKPKIATASLAGCFGCHMSLLDIDDRILKVIELTDFDKSPVDDIKKFTGQCLVGLIEGGCCNEENVKVLQDFRKNCDVLVALGDCATMGGLPALRNGIPLKECMREAYINGPTVYNETGRIPNDPELPLILDQVYPLHEVVKIDVFLPGCPPSADTIWEALLALLSNKPLQLPYNLLKYD
jgi:NAD-reducing hydrogenase small subunit